MLLNETEIEKNLINSFYTSLLLTFDFLYLFSSLFPLLFVILLNILFINNLFFKGTLTQLNIFKINNMFFIFILIIYIYL